MEKTETDDLILPLVKHSINVPLNSLVMYFSPIHPMDETLTVYYILIHVQ